MNNWGPTRLILSQYYGQSICFTNTCVCLSDALSTIASSISSADFTPGDNAVVADSIGRLDLFIDLVSSV